MAKTPEGHLLKSALEYLELKRVLAFRMNTGAFKTDTRFVRFGVPGMADVLAFKQFNNIPCWLELKAPKGVQSALQKSFQQQVEAEGHVYAIIRSIEDLKAVVG